MVNLTCSRRDRIVRVSSGSVLIYATFSLILILGICVLAVDFGRVTVARAELKTAADAAVRAGGMRLIEGGDITSVLAAANLIITRNTVDGSSVKTRTGSVRIGVYDPASKRFFETNDIKLANAVSVTLEHSFARDGMPLFFAQLLTSGQDSTVRSESLVMLSGVPAGFNVATFTTTTPGSNTSTPPSSTTSTVKTAASTSNSTPPANTSTQANNTQANNTQANNTQARSNTQVTTSTRSTSTTPTRTTASSNSSGNNRASTSANTNTTSKTNTPPKSNNTSTNSGTNTKSGANAGTASNSSTNSGNGNNTSGNTSGSSTGSSKTTTTTTPGSSTSTPGSTKTVTVVTQTPGTSRTLVTIK